MIGTTIGNYRIVDKLGAGGMGEVYRAEDTVLEREVALKSLHPFLTQDAGRLERFHSEAKTLAKLNHPNIAILHSFFAHNDVQYMVMEYVEGENFESLIRRFGRIPLRRTLEMFTEALRGFEHAHAKGVIHRDIKPANLMLNAENVVKITDFGIARVVGGQRLTQTGKLIGTLEYMSPEQVRGQEQDARSDIYSLGILLYEMVAGQVPFSSESDFEIMRSHLEVAPRAMRDLSDDVPEEIEAIICKALAKDPAQRFANARDFRLALEPILATLPAAAPEIVPQIRATREVSSAALLPPSAPSSAPATGTASPPPTRADIPKTSTSGVLPSWLKPQIAVAGVIALLLLVGLSTAAMRLRSPSETVKSDPDVALVGSKSEDAPATPAADSKVAVGDSSPANDVPLLPPIESEPPQPRIIPLPPAATSPARKPAATARPRPAAKPQVPKVPVRKSKAATVSRPRRKVSEPRRTVAPKRRRTVRKAVRRSTPVRRSRPRSSGGGEAALRDAIKNN